MATSALLWSNRFGARRRNRTGVTLMELLLVLALLVLVGAMASPAVTRTFEGQKLIKSADSIRAQLARARVRAMKSGRMQMFRFQPGTGEYELRPFVSQDDANETNLTKQALPPTGQSIDFQNPDLVSGEQITTRLRDNIVFHAVSTSRSVREAIAEQKIGSNANLTAESAIADWSTPILLYPDGTSSDARLVLGNKREQYVLIQIRGLTGVAQVSGLLSVEELPQ